MPYGWVTDSMRDWCDIGLRRDCCVQCISGTNEGGLKDNTIAKTKLNKYFTFVVRS